MDFASGIWNKPRGVWAAVYAGVPLSPGAAVPRNGVPVRVTVPTLCGGMVTDLDGVPKEDCTAEQFARQCQLVASAIHFGSRRCRECLAAFGWALTPHERAFLYASDPNLGAALGLDIVRGEADSQSANRPKPPDMRRISP